MKLTSLVNLSAEILDPILKTFASGGTAHAVPADALIAGFFRARKFLGSQDRRFIAETAYGAIRHLRRIENLLTRSGFELEPIRALPRVLVYLVWIDEGRSDARTGELLKAYEDVMPLHRVGAGELSAPVGGDPAVELADRYSFAPWMVQAFIDVYGPAESELLCRKLNEQAPLTIRANAHKVDRKGLQEILSTHGLPTRPTPHSPLGLILTKRVNVFALEPFRQGMFEVQDEGSQILPLLMDPKPTAKVLDACAGAGGKTLELSALMKNRGEIVATDVSSRRLEELRRRARRAGAFNIRIREEDFTDPQAGGPSAIYDHVLLDAPCSGTGTIRRNPGLKWTVSASSVAELVEKQGALLATTSRLVRPGGILWYCTCSLLRSENEGVVEDFLSRHESFARLDPDSFLGRVGIEGAASKSGVHLLPHRHGTDGFFCAPLQRMT